MSKTLQKIRIEKQQKDVYKHIFFRTSSVSEMNEQFPDSLLIVLPIVIVFGIATVTPNILAVILALNISLGLTLFLVFMLGSMLMEILPLPHRLPGCLLRCLLPLLS